MFGPMWKMSAQMVEAFIPGVGKTMIPVEDVVQAQRVTPGMMISNNYKSIGEIKELNRKKCNPVFILSKSPIWRKRAARILYGTEEEDYFL